MRGEVWIGPEFRQTTPVGKSSYVYRRIAYLVPGQPLVRVKIQVKRALRDTKKRAALPWGEEPQYRSLPVDKVLGFAANGMNLDPFTAAQLQEVAVCVDMALTIRAEAEQAKAEREMDEERKAMDAERGVA